MLDKSEFERIRKEFKKFEEGRERVIQTSRQVINLSKQIIFSMQRNEKQKAEGLLKDIKATVKKLPEEQFDAGIQNVAKQEFVEAIAFYEFSVNNRIPTSKQLGIDDENYLMGLCDLTGELVRKAVMDGINKDFSSAKKIHGIVEEIYGEFLKFDMRNGELRKKADSIKWNLKKLDELLYDIGMKRK
jgi:predicted translin family RNA/ssDNA-binding protein